MSATTTDPSPPPLVEAPADRTPTARRARVADALPGALMAIAVVALGFTAGGFFAGGTAAACLAAGAALLLWVTASARPFAALGPLLGATAALLAALAVWTLLSSTWGIGTGARALVEFDRTLLYLLVVALAGLAAATPAARAGLLRGLAGGTVVVCGAGLITRVLPDVWPIADNVQADRLSYPVTYWNTLGLLALLGLLAVAHLSASERERAWVRVAASGAVPVLALALFFTFSRGAIALVPVGLLVYLVLGRPRFALAALLAAGPPTAAALAVAWGADALTSGTPTSAVAVDEGRGVALAAALAVVVAAGLRLALVRVEERLVPRVRVQPARLAAIGAVALALAGVVAVAAGAPGWVDRQVEAFAEGDVVSNEGDRRDRLGTVGNNGRLGQWEVALDGFERDALRGVGAGTYALAWDRMRPEAYQVVDAHSLYLEVLGELGLVGLLLVVAVIALMLVACVRAARGPDRALGAAAAAIVLVWAVRAGIDWDWEMPVVTAPVLALGAAFAASGRLRSAIAAPPQLVRVVVGLGVLVVLVTPALMWSSQGRLDEAVAAFRAGDCATAVDRALAANSVLSARPEPFEVLGYCDARLGQGELAVRAFKAGIDRDPESWRLHYGLALVRAAQGQDPVPRLRIALRQSPLEELPRLALELFDGAETPDERRRRAARARLPL
jgi:hypothetical protein